MWSLFRLKWSESAFILLIIWSVRCRDIPINRSEPFWCQGVLAATLCRSLLLSDQVKVLLANHWQTLIKHDQVFGVGFGGFDVNFLSGGYRSSHRLWQYWQTISRREKMKMREVTEMPQNRKPITWSMLLSHTYACISIFVRTLTNVLRPISITKNQNHGNSWFNQINVWTKAVNLRNPHFSWKMCILVLTMQHTHTHIP